jgi:hypothetical protein
MTRKSTRRSTRKRAVQPHRVELAADSLDSRAGDIGAGDTGTGKNENEAVAVDLSESVRSALDPSGAQADRAMVDRCLLGEVDAWEELYRQCHDPLCASIAAMLGNGFHDPNLVDDIAARVWYALVKNDGDLLDRFDPCRDLRLGVFFRGLARVELMQYFRAEQRRIQRERKAGKQPRLIATMNEWQVGVLLKEFMTTLTPGEKRFMDEYLLSLPAEGDDKEDKEEVECLSDANIWQRRHRIREKLLKFFGNGN